MLDVRRSLPMGELLQAPTVLELEGMGDDDDKAFVMGLLLVRLLEHRRAASGRPGLEHLLVVEEAHRLLTQVGPRRGEEQGDPRGKAVETFTNLLAEIRAYGQGVIVADQVPVRLAPEVVKNTGLKVAHRVVAVDDRAVLAGTMAMDEEQARAVGTLGAGEAAVFGEGDDRPILVKIPLVKDMPGREPPTDAQLADRAHGPDGTPSTEYEDLARALIERPTFRRTFVRLVQAAIEDVDAFDWAWSDLQAQFNAARPPRADAPRLAAVICFRASQWLAERRGAANKWTYAETVTFADRLQDVLLAKLEARDGTEARQAFRDHAEKLHRRTHDPYPGCSRVCTQQPPVCLYRSAAADLVAGGSVAESWRAADAADIARADGQRSATYEVCLDAGYDIVASRDAGGKVTAAQRRAGLCFAQQMLFANERRSPSTNTKIIDRLLIEGPSEAAS
jgi:hypothetical protein